MSATKRKANNKKKTEAFRLRKSIRTLLVRIKSRTGKTKTRIIEEAIVAHARELIAT